MQEMLYKKYRPKSFQDFFGNRHVISIIKNSLLMGRISHAYLLTGPRGTGKTSLARLIAKSLNCLAIQDGYNPCSSCENCISISKYRFPDMIEIDAASNRGIEEIREVKESVNYKPIVGKYKIYIIDEVHMLTREAFNALLKTLEEPPRHVIFILATTEPEKVPDTVISRCQRHDLRLIDREFIIERVKGISSAEGRELDEEAIELLVRESGLSMRDALSLLEKVLNSTQNREIGLQDAREALGVIPSELVLDFSEGYFSKNARQMLEVINRAWDSGYRVESLVKELASILILKVEESAEYSHIEDIRKIYEAINEFRLEENKKAVGYVIVSRLTGEMPELKTSKEIEHKPVKVEEAKADGGKAKTVKMEEVKVKGVKAEEPEGEKVKAAEVRTEERKETKEPLPQEPVKPLFSKIKSEWTEVVQKVRERSISVMLFLINATLDSLDGDNSLVLAYDESHVFHKESLEKTENRIILEDVLSKAFGVEIRVKLRYLNNLGKDLSFEERVRALID